MKICYNVLGDHMEEQKGFDVKYIIKVCAVTDMIHDTAVSLRNKLSKDDMIHYEYLPKLRKKMYEYIETLSDYDRMRMETQINNRSISLGKKLTSIQKN